MTKNPGDTPAGNIKALAAKPAVKPGDPKAMQQLLQTFANDGKSGFTREFETKSDDGHFSSLAAYRQLLVAVGASIGPLADGAQIENAQGITLALEKKSKITTECTITIPAEAFMKIAAAYGYDATAKLMPEHLERWAEIKVEALSARAAATITPPRP